MKIPGTEMSNDQAKWVMVGMSDIALLGLNELILRGVQVIWVTYEWISWVCAWKRLTYIQYFTFPIFDQL